MRYLKSISYSALVLFILLTSVAAFFLNTTPGLYLTVKLANVYLPGKIHLKKPEGRLLDGAAFKTLTYDDDTINIQLNNARLNWKLNSLSQFSMNLLQADQLIITMKDTQKTTDTGADILELPINVQVKKLAIERVEINIDKTRYQLQKLQLQADVNNEQWTIPHLEANAFGQHVTLQASAQPKAPFNVSGLFTFAPLTPLDSGLNGKITFGGDIALYHWQGDFDGLAKGQLSGTLKNGYELSTKASWRDGRWAANKNTILHSAKGHLSINGTLQDLVFDLKTHVTSPVNTQWQASARLKKNQLSASSVLHMPQGDINSTFSYDGQSSPKFSGEISSKTLDLGELNWPLSQLEFKTEFRGDSPQLITAKTTLSARYMGNALNATINYAKQQLNAKITLGKNTFTVSGKPPYQWQANASLPQPQLLHPAFAGLQTTLIANATLANAQQGKLVVSMRPGSYQLPHENKAMPAIDFMGGHLDVVLSSKSLKAKGTITIDKQKTLNLSLRLPEFRLDQKPRPTQALDGNLSLHINSLDFLQGISPAIEKLQGQVNIAMSAQGSLEKPVIKGELGLTNASLFLPQLNLMLSSVQAKLTSENKQWQTVCSISADGKTLTINGDGSFSPDLTGTINLNGENFPAMKTAEYTVNISPQLTLALTPQGLALNGTIVFPSAQLKPTSFSSSVSLSDDVVFVSDKPTSHTPLNMSVDVQIQMGQDVALDIQGLHGFLDGAVQIRQLPRGEPYAIGELAIRDGKYTAYGQDLIIQQGLLQFTGGLINNPAIRLRAVRQFNNTSARFAGSNQLFDFNPENTQTLDFGNKTTVGIEVSGRINSTKIKLFSIPATLSQADILSMIILGRPANQASKSGGQLLLTALSSMNLDSGTNGLQLLDQLKESIGFDINVQNSQGFNQKTNQVTDNTTLVVGKSLSKRLYLSYNVDIFQNDSNMLTLKYLLNKFFSIQVTASDSGSGIDLLYTHST